MGIHDILSVLGCCGRRNKNSSRGWRNANSDDSDTEVFELPSRGGEVGPSSARGIRNIGSSLNPFVKKDHLLPTSSQGSVIFSSDHEDTVSSTLLATEPFDEVDLSDMAYDQTYGSSSKPMPVRVTQAEIRARSAAKLALAFPPTAKLPLAIHNTKVERKIAPPQATVTPEKKPETATTELPPLATPELETATKITKSSTGDDRDSLPSQQHRLTSRPSSLRRTQHATKRGRPASLASKASSSSSIKRKPVGSGYTPLAE